MQNKILFYLVCMYSLRRGTTKEREAADLEGQFGGARNYYYYFLTFSMWLLLTIVAQFKPQLLD